jgi:hypothetical protein
MTEPIGFIGLGIMGAPMAGHVGSRKAARASGRGKLAQPAIIQLWESLLGIEVKSV